MGEVINFLDKRASSKYGRNPLEPRIAVPEGILASKIMIDDGQEINGNIVNVSAGGLALVIDSLDYELARGTEIEKITIETPNGSIFETKGLVTHITPEIEKSEFAHRLGLGFKRKESPTLDKLVISKSDRMFDILAKEEEMTRIVEDLVLIGDEAKMGIKLDANTDVYGQFNKKSQLIKINSFHIDFEDETHCMAFEVEKEFTFFFTLFRSFYLFRSKILANTGKSIEVAIPDFFVKLMRRNTSRIPFNDTNGEKAQVTIKHPYRPERELKKPITDINEEGFSIELSEDDSIFPVGISLREIVLEIPGLEPIKTLGRLVHVDPIGREGKYKCGIKFFERDEGNRRAISEYVFYKRFPLLFPAGKEDYDKVWELFEKSGYLDEKPRESFELVREDSNPAWKKLDSSNGVLARNVTATDGNKITGVMHVSRVYDNSWILHHFCILQGYQRTVTTSVYGGMIDQLLVGDAEYFVCYYNADKSWNQKNYDDFKNQYPYKDETFNKKYELFEFDLTKQNMPSPDEKSEITVHEGSDFDIKGIARFFEMNHEKIQVEALDLSLEKLKMDSLGEKYDKEGLERGRKFFIAKRGKETIGFALLDICSTGLNIYALLDSFRVYTINSEEKDKERIFKLLAIKALDYFKSIGKKTVLFYSNDKDISFLSPLKYQRLCTIVLGIAHRNSFTRYTQYNADLFGRIMARRKKIRNKTQKPSKKTGNNP